jgi:hypothetical protein
MLTSTASSFSTFPTIARILTRRKRRTTAGGAVAVALALASIDGAAIRQIIAEEAARVGCG